MLLVIIAVIQYYQLGPGLPGTSHQVFVLSDQNRTQCQSVDIVVLGQREYLVRRSGSRSFTAFQRRFSRQLRDWRSVYSEVSWVQSSPVYRLETVSPAQTVIC